MAKGETKQKNNSGLKMLLVLLIAAIWVVSIIVLAIVLLPEGPKFPEFEIKDVNGSWESQGTVAVFDDSIEPGSSGEYNFIISNVTNVYLIYSFVMSEEYADYDGEWTSFMQYRFKMNGQYVGTDNWLSADELLYNGIKILPKTQQLMTLEWRWPFYGDDVKDTNIGNHGGSYSVVFELKAEVLE